MATVFVGQFASVCRGKEVRRTPLGSSCLGFRSTRLPTSSSVGGGGETARVAVVATSSAATIAKLIHGSVWAELLAHRAIPPRSEPAAMPALTRSMACS